MNVRIFVNGIEERAVVMYGESGDEGGREKDTIVLKDVLRE